MSAGILQALMSARFQRATESFSQRRKLGVLGGLLLL
jgi:hypothetical protein